MAEHVWSVLCRRGIRDAETGVVSLIEVTERILLHSDPDALLAEVKQAQANKRPGVKFPYSLQIVSWWVRSDYAKEEASDMVRAFIITPSNIKLSFPEELLVLGEATTGARVFYRIEDLPFEGFGIYWFTIEQQRLSKSRKSPWKLVTKIPLEMQPAPTS
jgi:hypothetical protein